MSRPSGAAQKKQAQPLPPDPRALGSRLAASPLVVLLDVDGTLSPIAPRPEDAVVPAPTRAALAALVRTTGTHVALVSGRGASDARRLVGVEGVWAIGNHGLETIAPDGALTVDERVAPFADALRRARDAASAAAAGVPGARVEDKGATLSVHYRQVSDAAAIERLARSIAAAAGEAGLRVTHGRKVIEVRPPVAVDKGTAVLALAARLGASSESGSILFAGDDVTDEDAMRALRGWRRDVVTIHVEGEEPRETDAEFAAGSPGELGKWLAALASMREGGEKR